MARLTCTRRGCGKEYEPAQNTSAECVFHPGQPVFHEGLKSWSCCKEKNKPVMEFDQFVKIQGCTTGTHSSEKVVVTTQQPKKDDTENSEHHHLKSAPKSSHKTTSDIFKPIRSQPAPPPPSSALAPEPKIELQDDPESVVPDHAKCSRLGCGVTWNGLGNCKRGELVKDECTYHPGTPIFHEGSKGYSCCKRRVLDFDDFLKLTGCKKTSHLFTGGVKDKTHDSDQQEESVQCRFDFYQTPTLVIVSIFAKNLVKDHSLVSFDPDGVIVDLKLPPNKRFQKRFDLFGKIDPNQSSFKFLSTKCEMVLFKSDGCSWSNLEKGDTFAGTVTFGVGGRTGTVGAKQIVT